LNSAGGLAGVAAAFARARSQGRGALIPYVCAGDPDFETSLAILGALGPAGADLIELGIPYGDPLADGPTIAAAAQRALAAGTTVDRALDLARRALAGGAPPILMFTYLNPLVQYGLARFGDALVAAGVAGAVVPDVPLEESGPLREIFAARGLAMPLLVAPTTPPERAAAIAAESTGFTYIVSRLGVTSAAREPDFPWIERRVRELRPLTQTPLAVGFGIATAEHVRSATACADAAIVGSALIDAVAGTLGEEAVERASSFICELHQGLHRT
jgi:tryptophan synthase alpha chain